MISFDDAFQKVLENTIDLGDQSVSLMGSAGCILAENIKADRDFPPFDRSTKDGIAISFSAIEKGIDRFKIESIASAGMQQKTLSSDTHCIEIMTGAVLPENADTVIMYEQTDIDNGYATINKTHEKGQNIHGRGNDAEIGSVLLEKGIDISPAVIGVLASVGKTDVLVKKMPKVCVISTGNELVEVSQTPLPHQIRKSNTLSLTAALQRAGIKSTTLHLADDQKTIEKGLLKALAENDVLMLSGGVSKGKFDFIPGALKALGVKRIFHCVAQRPGKPFWFGTVENQDAKGARRKTIFSFPGNPVSTFANYHVYFLPWLAKCLNIDVEQRTVILDEPVHQNSTLTLFLQVTTKWSGGVPHAQLLRGNGSGDLVGLAKADGFIRIPAGSAEFGKGTAFGFIPCT